jgi:hypothetical protein
MSKEYKHWNTEKKLIPVMIRTYCRGNHKTERKAEGVKGKELCSKCKELAEYAAFRLEKCPFKRNKGFCSYCKIHCYKPEYRAEMKEVMKYSGPKMLFSHPIFAMSHVTAMIKYKKQLKKQAKRQSDKNAGAEKVRSAQTNDQKKDTE